MVFKSLAKERKIGLEQITQLVGKGITPAECQEIISEFDTDADGCLSYKEFINLCLPAANERVRKQALRRKDGSADLSGVKKILEMERFLAQTKIEARNALMQIEDFSPEKEFTRITGGLKVLSVI